MTPINKDITFRSLFNVYNPTFKGGYGGEVWDTNGIINTIKSNATASQHFVFVIVEVKDVYSNSKGK